MTSPLHNLSFCESVDLDAGSFDQRAPVSEIISDELGEALRREISPLEAVCPEEICGFGMIQCLKHVGINPGKKIGRKFSRPP